MRAPSTVILQPLAVRPSILLCSRLPRRLRGVTERGIAQALLDRVAGGGVEIQAAHRQLEVGRGRGLDTQRWVRGAAVQHDGGPTAVCPNDAQAIGATTAVAKREVGAAGPRR